jgi:hypothetical protein
MQCINFSIINHQALFQPQISANTYFVIGIIIWLLKVIISYWFIQPSTTRSPTGHSIFIMMVFYSPNILFWPINIILDIYALSAECITTGPISLKTFGNEFRAFVGF